MALFDAFLKLDGIKGESADSKHKGEIDIMSFSWGMKQSGTSATGGGAGAGKVKMLDFQITKQTDAASPLLMLACANGKHLKEATFVCRKAGGDQLEFLKIKLTDVLVSSYSPFATVNAELTGGTRSLTATSAAGGDGGFTGGVRTGDSGMSPGAQEIPTENVSFNFAKVEVQYQAQGADGKASGGPVIAGWDVKGNAKV